MTKMNYGKKKPSAAPRAMPKIQGRMVSFGGETCSICKRVISIPGVPVVVTKGSHVAHERCAFPETAS